MKRSLLLRRAALLAMLALSAYHSAPTRAQVPPTVSPVVEIVNGGTGGRTAAQARANLGLGALATRDTIDIGSSFITGTIGLGQIPAFTGDVTSTVGTTALTIAVSAVTTAKIADAAVTAAKLAPGAVIGNLGFTPVNPTDDFSQFAVFPTGSPDPVVLADVASAALNGLHVIGTVAANHVLIGGAGPNEVLDSGATFCAGFSENYDPGPAQDATQNYCAGSTGINKLTGVQFVAISVDTPGGAIWRATSSPLAAPIPYSFSLPQIASGATVYFMSGTQGTTTNTQGQTSIAGRFSTLTIHLAGAPGVGHHIDFMLMAGPPFAMVATGVGCTIADALFDCSTTTEVSSVIAAKQSWTVRGISSSGAALAGVGGFGALFTPGS